MWMHACKKKIAGVITRLELLVPVIEYQWARIQERAAQAQNAEEDKPPRFQQLVLSRRPARACVHAHACCAVRAVLACACMGTRKNKQLQECASFIFNFALYVTLIRAG